LILLLVGVVCIAVGEASLRNVNTVVVGQEDTVWSYAVNLTRGSKYGVDISSSDDWGKPFGSSDFTEPMPVNVTITSPLGGITSLKVFYYGEPSTSPYYKVGSPASIVAVAYQNVDSVGLAVDDFAYLIRFTAKDNGPYNVTVLSEGHWSKEPPDYILFFEIVTPNKEVYTLLATGGGVISTVGGVTFVTSLLKNRSKKRRRSRTQAQHNSSRA